MKTMKWLGAVAMMALLAGCASPQGAGQQSASSSNQGPIKIGLVTALSGSGALYGKQMENGAQLAVDEINQSGGLLGRQLQLVALDDQQNSTQSVTATHRLINQEHIDAWMGTLKSPDTLSDAGLTAKASIPTLVPVAVADNIVTAGYPHVFRNVADNTMQVKSLVDYILQKTSDRNVAIIAENTDYGRGIALTFNQNFQAGGGTVSDMEFYNVGQKEFTNELTKMKANHPQGLVIAGLVAEGALIAKQAKDLGMNVHLYSFGGFMGSQPIKLAGSAVDGLIHTDYFSPVQGDPKIETFVANYKQKFGEVPDSYYAAAPYDAVYFYAEGVKKAGTTDPKKVVEALHAIKQFQGVMGNITFDDHGQAQAKVWITQVQNGQQVVIYRPKS
ncbi:MAG TPA: branched-chain amino acid ABC transporter substrate-binding protein [Alicyclobacillus sp.]|nr:branched-chain amino acid ABC transporter substrate-binding protein [Alicyclobacillus sp.]